MRPSRRALAFLVLIFICEAAAASGQGAMPPATGTPGVAGEMRSVSGRVLSGSSDSLRPVAGQYVVLHRISADSSGPLDSMRTTAEGTYRFRYRLAGSRSMYIVSARYDGVAYFTTPLREANVGSPDADISVYDTTSAGFPLTVRARHVVVSPGESGTRRVVDVFEVANDSNLTLVGGTTGATWRIALPREARDPGSSGGDLPPDAFRFAGGVAELLVPFPPGSRQVVLTYAIPARSATIPIVHPTANLEVLLEGAEGSATGAGLTAEEPVSLEGRTFGRFTATAAPAGASVVISGGSSGSATRVALLAVAVAAIALGIVVGRRGVPSATANTAAPAASPDAIARAIAALDHIYADASSRHGAAGNHYRDRREALMRRLVDAQAVEDRVAVR